VGSRASVSQSWSKHDVARPYLWKKRGDVWERQVHPMYVMIMEDIESRSILLVVLASSPI
jgi:hypothetical protein